MTEAQGARERADRLHAELRRFPAELFGFDPRLRTGWLTDRYFVRTADTLRHAGTDPDVTMQVFAKRYGMVAGIYEAIRMLQTQLAPGAAAGALRVESLLEGDLINQGGPDEWETVMHIH